MRRDAVAAHSGGKNGSVSVAELLSRHGWPRDGAAPRTGHRVAAAGGSAVLLALVAGAVTLSGEDPAPRQPVADMPQPEHISGGGVALVDSTASTPPAGTSGAAAASQRRAAEPAADTGRQTASAAAGPGGGTEPTAGQPAATEPTARVAAAGEPTAAGVPAVADEPATTGAASSPAQPSEPAQPAEGSQDEAAGEADTEQGGLLRPVTGLVAETTDTLGIS